MQRSLPEGECQVWCSGTGHDLAPLRDLLDPAERARAQRLRHPASRHRFVLGRAMARLVVARTTGLPASRVAFEATCRHCGGPHGRLAVAGAERLHLSISHSGERVAVAVSRSVVCGVDVERIALRGRKVPLTALSPAEQEALASVPPGQRLAAFIRYWTRKEALLKATGDGLVVAPANLTVSPPDTAPRLVSWRDRPPPDLALYLSDLAVGGHYQGAVATLGRRLVVRQRSAETMIRNVRYIRTSH